MAFDYTLLIAIFGVVWSGYQEVKMWKMCQECPYKNYKKEKESYNPITS